MPAILASAYHSFVGSSGPPEAAAWMMRPIDTEGVMALLAPRPFLALTGDRDAYLYLGDTIGKFPTREELTAEIRAAGFGEITATPMTFGIVALHSAAKPDDVS